jgi:hypothetical protein
LHNRNSGFSRFLSQNRSRLYTAKAVTTIYRSNGFQPRSGVPPQAEDFHRRQAAIDRMMKIWKAFMGTCFVHNATGW